MERNGILNERSDSQKSSLSDVVTSWNSAGVSMSSAQDLPFLVTRWLASYDVVEELGKSETSDGDGDVSMERESDVNKRKREEALRRIHRAAAELASAFSSLGAFGTALQSPVETVHSVMSSGGRWSPSLWHEHSVRNATYADMARRWANVAPKHLESIMHSSAAGTDAANRSALGRVQPSSLIDAAYEGNAFSASESCALPTGAVGDGNGGRRLGERTSDDSHDASALLSSSVLQSQTLLAPLSSSSFSTTEAFAASLANTSAMQVDSEIEKVVTGHAPSQPPPQRQLTVSLASDHGRIGTTAAHAARRYLALREKSDEEERVMRGLQRSLDGQEKMRCGLRLQRETQLRLIQSGEVTEKAGLPANGVCNSSGKEPFQAAGAVPFITPTNALDEIRLKEHDIERVVAQLQRKLSELLTTHAKTQASAQIAGSLARNFYREVTSSRRKYRDPFRLDRGPNLPVPLEACGARGSALISTVVSRQYGGGGCWRQSLSTRRPYGMHPSFNATSLNRKAIITKRMSHAVTVNCHLFYPVYCLRFDRTGRYFITGADDHLVKLFHLGSSISSVDKHKEGTGAGGRLKFNYGANCRGAVLVCTFRGHAGVITDVAVSADNAMLATASEDGDVRIWGLRDGCPIAILRGHTGGACMVSWSTLTPYRLVTSGEDGLARMWDVREAALKRYGSVVGKRLDYVLPDSKILANADIKGQSLVVSSSDDGGDGDDEHVIEEEAVLPPLPVRQQEDQGSDNNQGFIAGNTDRRAGTVGTASDSNVNHENRAIVVPPLPPDAEGISAIVPGALVGAAAIGNGVDHSNIAAPGAFVASDQIDEGVNLIAKLQHGEVIQGSEQHVAGTRSRRKAVKVICVTHCPIGGHFATGSDDGLGRIWADEDDCCIESIDKNRREHNSIYGNDSMTVLSTKGKSPRKAKRRGTRKYGSIHSGTPNIGAAEPSRETLLATLRGHLTSVTDIQYSNAGDRILTASQKDGVVRVWSWGKELSATAAGIHGPGATKFSNLSQILIQLVVPSDCRKTGHGLAVAHSTSTRRRGGSSAASATNDQTVSCDVAVWTSDDSKIVTSQSCPLKSTGTEIVEGSHCLYVWDSRSGQCLLGMTSAHSAPCPVLVSHPFEPSIIASAGADGHLNVWDLEKGLSFLCHKNVIEHGPVEPPTDRGKISGYLDGTFSPDGLYLVLTDDSGRITIFDTLDSAEGAETSKAGGGNNTGTESNPIPLFPLHATNSDPNGRASTSLIGAPEWMREQYFANDYYELFYDGNGYCVERGSEQPPHVAPRGARCSHLGAPHSETINEAFQGMMGPAPLPERDCRLGRDLVRSRSVEVRQEGGVLGKNTYSKRSVTYARSCDESGSTMMICPSGPLRQHASQCAFENEVDRGRLTRDVFGGARNDRRNNNRNLTSTGRPLSSNYRWRDYDDVLREEEANDEDAIDLDDEEYEYAPRGSSGRHLSSDDDMSDPLELSDEDEFIANESNGGREHHNERSLRSSSRRTRRSSNGQRLGGRAFRRGIGRERDTSSARSLRQNRRSRAREQSVTFQERVRNQPSRVSARQLSTTNTVQPYTEAGSSDEDIVEEISTNNTPSGPFIDDYTFLGHFFKMPDGILHRAWLCRDESKNGYCGRKNYAPQVGDSVVYIPRAHYETLKRFPIANSSAPWKDWPTSSAWPVVRCLVRDIRYRFPYEAYYRKVNQKEARCISIVAIVTLEVTGIPQISVDAGSSWPTPHFISRQTRSSSDLTFEVSMFESGEVDFIIPEYLYIWRIESLESAIREHNSDAVGLELIVFYEEDKAPAEEDAELEPYSCKITKCHSEPGNENELHLHRSGFDVFEVEWASGGNNSVSTWEVNVSSNIDDMPDPPCLDEAEEEAIREALENIKKEPAVQSWFYHPVDVRRYSDYLNRIEIPMSGSFIEKRLRNNYYSNKLSVVADMKLIRDNCIKYNDPHSVISKSANEVYEKFKGMIEEIEDVPTARTRHGRDGFGSGAGMDLGLVEQEAKADASASSNEDNASTHASDSVHHDVLYGTSARRTRRRSPLGDATLSNGDSRASPRTASSSCLEQLPLPSNTRGTTCGSRRVESGSHDCVESSRSTRQTRAAASSAASSSGEATTRRVTRAATKQEVSSTKDIHNDDSLSSDEEDLDDSNSEEGADGSEFDYGSDNYAESEEDNHSLEASEVDNDSMLPAKATRTSSRPRKTRSSVDGLESRRSKRNRVPKRRKSDSSVDYVSEEEEEEETDEEVVKRKRPKLRVKIPVSVSSGEGRMSTRSSTLRNKKAATRDTGSHDKSDQSDAASTTPPREQIQSRTRARRHSSRIKKTPSYDEQNSDEFTDGNKPEGELKQAQSSKRAHRQTPTVTNYEDPSSDEFSDRTGSDDDGTDVSQSASSTEVVSSKRRTERGSVKRRKGIKGRAHAKKAKASIGEPKAGYTYLPDIALWPDVDMKVITDLSKAIINKVVKADTLNLFALPVYEQYPQLADSYLSVVKEPMDFRTIREDRMPTYQSIQELQDDLILVFRNCCAYNAEGSEFFTHALNLWQGLNDIFRAACKEMGVRIPRRW